MNQPTHLLYLHGFRSSPRSFKARCLAQWLAENQPQVQVWCPQLPASPALALALVLVGTAAWPAATSVVVGSSLGGFYASLVAEKRGWPALLLNPAVDPARDLAAHIGEQTAFHSPEERFFFCASYVEELRAMAPAATSLATSSLLTITRPERYAALITEGDEVLDWREMAAHYAGARLRIVPGSDHGISDFMQHLPWCVEQLGLAQH